MKVWVCRAGKNSVYHSNFLANNKIFLTWDNWGIDLRMLPEDKDSLRKVVSEECGDNNRSSISNHLSQILIFRDRMTLGDWVIVPGIHSKEYSFGIIKSEYQYSPDAKEHFRHWRIVEWKYHNVLRSTFSQSMQYSLGAYRTIFSLKNTDEFETFVMLQKGCEQHGRK